MQVTYYGHSCFLVICGGKRILFDPFISKNPLAAGISLDAIDADYIFISHGHEDHTADALMLAQKTNATVVGNWEVHTWFQKHGITKTHPMNIGGSWQFEFGKVKMIEAVHSSSFPDGTYAGNPGGYYFMLNELNFYYAGDTALYNGMKLLGRFANLDLAFLPIGDNFTMGPEDALIASKYIKCDRIIGMHFDTFDLIRIDHADAQKKFSNQDKKLILMKVGEVMEIA
jgi:L-ascorbate metabolism protein UlaG (beta-lactamase superfamily)